MSIPVLRSASTGFATATSGASLADNVPADSENGDFLVAHVVYNGNTAAPTTPTGWTMQSGSPDSIGGANAARHWLFYKIDDGTLAGDSIDFGTNAITTVRAVRIYCFDLVDVTSGVETDSVEGYSGPAGANSATIQDTGVTTSGADRLACNFVGVNDDNAVGSFTGETGGDWTEATAEFTTTLGTDLCLQLQTAPMASAGTIDGGTYVMAASDPYGCIGIALIGASGGQAINVTQATETDSALSATTSKSLAAGIGSETDSAVAATASKSLAAGISSETDSAVAATVTKSVAAGLATETDTVLPPGTPVGRAIESDSVLAATSLKTLAVALASETDSALAATALKSLVAGIALETDSVFSITVSKAKAVGLASETDEALEATVDDGAIEVAVTMAEEMDTPLPVTVRKLRAVGFATETDTLLSVTKLKTKTVGITTETDEALGATVYQVVLPSDREAVIELEAGLLIVDLEDGVGPVQLEAGGQLVELEPGLSLIDLRDGTATLVSE